MNVSLTVEIYFLTKIKVSLRLVSLEASLLGLWGGLPLAASPYSLSLCVCKHNPGVSVCPDLLQEYQSSWVRAPPNGLI